MHLTFCNLNYAKILIHANLGLFCKPIGPIVHAINDDVKNGYEKEMTFFITKLTRNHRKM